MSISAIIWTVVGVVYFAVIFGMVAYYYSRQPAEKREFWHILFTLVLCLIFGPIIIVLGLISAVAQLFRK